MHRRLAPRVLPPERPTELTRTTPTAGTRRLHRARQGILDRPVVQNVLLLLRQLRRRREQLRVADGPLSRRRQRLEIRELLRTQHPVRLTAIRERRPNGGSCATRSATTASWLT